MVQIAKQELVNRLRKEQLKREQTRREFVQMLPYVRTKYDMQWFHESIGNNLQKSTTSSDSETHADGATTARKEYHSYAVVSGLLFGPKQSGEDSNCFVFGHPG